MGIITVSRSFTVHAIYLGVFNEGIFNYHGNLGFHARAESPSGTRERHRYHKRFFIGASRFILSQVRQFIDLNQNEIGGGRWDSRDSFLRCLPEERLESSPTGRTKFPMWTKSGKKLWRSLKTRRKRSKAGRNAESTLKRKLQK